MGLIIFLIIIAICVRTLLVRANESSLVKYDKRQMKFLKILTIIGLVLAITGYAQLADLIDINFVFGLISFLFGSGLFFFCSIELIQGALYFNRLKKYGYEIPESKKDFSNRVDRLPKAMPTENAKVRWNCVNIFMATLFFIGFVVCIAFNIWLTIFSGYMNMDLLFFGILSLCDLIWLILSLVIYNQANSQSYRDDMEIDEGDMIRRVRRPAEVWITSFVILLIFTMIAKSGVLSMVRYVFYARMSRDMDTMTTLSGAIEEIYLNNEQTEEGKDFYESLESGIYITEMDAPQGKLWEDVVAWVNANQNASYAVDNMNGLAKNMKCANGPAKIWIKLDQNQLTVRLVNPLEKTIKRGADMLVQTDFGN